MYHSFFIHSSVDGHLGCFHVLAVVNSAEINIRVHVSFRIVVFSGYMPSNEIAESRGSFIPPPPLFFKKSPYCSPQWVYQFTFPPTLQEDFLFSTSFSAFITSRFFDGGHSDQWEVIPYCSFDLHFTTNKNGLVVFHTFFNLSLDLAIRSSWSEPQSAPGLVFADCIEILHLWLQRI